MKSEQRTSLGPYVLVAGLGAVVGAALVLAVEGVWGGAEEGGTPRTPAEVAGRRPAEGQGRVWRGPSLERLPATAEESKPGLVEEEAPPGRFIPYGVWPEGLSEAVLPESVADAVMLAAEVCGGSAEPGEVDCASYPCLVAVPYTPADMAAGRNGFVGLCTLPRKMLDHRFGIGRTSGEDRKIVYAVIDPAFPMVDEVEFGVAVEIRRTLFMDRLSPEEP